MRAQKTKVRANGEVRIYPEIGATAKLPCKCRICGLHRADVSLPDIRMQAGFPESCIKIGNQPMPLDASVTFPYAWQEKTGAGEEFLQMTVHEGRSQRGQCEYTDGRIVIGAIVTQVHLEIVNWIPTDAQGISIQALIAGYVAITATEFDVFLC